MLELSTGLIYSDILMARQALHAYKEKPKLKDIKNACAYHLQQATEKLIKIQIYKSGFSYNDRDMYTHNIGLLLAYVQKHHIAIYVPSFIDKNSHIITNWEAGSRYDIHFSIRVDTLEKYLLEIERWYQSIYKQIK